MGSGKGRSGREAESSHGLRKFRELNARVGQRGLLALWSQETRLRRLCRLSLLGNSSPAAPAVLTSPVGPIFNLRLAQGRMARRKWEGVTSWGLWFSFCPQYLRFPGPGWSCLFSFLVSQCGQEGPRGGLDLVCQRLGR